MSRRSRSRSDNSRSTRSTHETESVLRFGSGSHERRPRRKYAVFFSDSRTRGSLLRELLRTGGAFFPTRLANSSLYVGVLISRIGFWGLL